MLTGRQPESVISIEPRDGDWCVGVEVVETRRIPDSADILAIYEVLVGSGGDLISYRRTRRYTGSPILTGQPRSGAPERGRPVTP